MKTKQEDTTAAYTTAQIQALSALTWHGFKREIEEKHIHSADFAEDITYAMMITLYKVEDLTIIGV